MLLQYDIIIIMSHCSTKPESSSDESYSEDDNTSIKYFMDESDSDTDIIPDKKILVKREYTEPIIGKISAINYVIPNAHNYIFKSWTDCFPDKKINLRSLIFNPSWYDFFDIVEKKPYYQKIEKILSESLGKKNLILPHAELVFNSLNILSPERISIVIIGQDPYPGGDQINGKFVPHACGFSFSVPMHSPKPSSLGNIYKNLLHYKHIRKIPESGCLSPLVMQGCFMINATLTTIHMKKNEHENVWRQFTDDLVEYINRKCNNIVWLVWGKFAHCKCKSVNPDVHHIVTSSHPSPLAYDKTFSGQTYGDFKNERDRKHVTYQPFRDTDHFGKANAYLKSVGKQEILWDLID